MTLTAPTVTPTVDRDRWGRPLIRQADGTTKPYTRATTLAKTLSDGTALAAWQQRMTAYGLARRTDLVALAATATLDERDKLTEVVTAAMETAEAARGARLGTAIHSASELVDAGRTDDVPDMLRGVADAYATLTSGARLDPVAVELFIVDDDLEAAGTADRLYRLPDGRVIVGDLKTGKADAPRYAALEWSTQLAVYAYGHRYDPATGERTPLHRDIDPTTGVIVHVPSDGAPPALYRLRLDWGREAARLATRVRRARRAPMLTPWQQ